ncbi:RNA polymerase sigma factor SigZ [Vibrio sp. SCSIO 43135]|uniref:RNA polymerase sigma factor SigZ n=1 Tax=Vibrio sp. SCSIO 43135 TaxID=2819096 RepID=UPI002075BB13|nr:RNA polymerase sigma factor SigZ [Vibrio sp. SCSIO 43135]
MSAALMKAADPIQLEQVWGEYQQSLKSFLYSKVNHHEDVEDLLQEILIKTYQNLSTLKDADSIKSWLFQVANRTIIDFYRKRARNQRDQELETDDLWFENGERELEQEMSACIAPFIQALPESNASLLSAVDLEGQSQKALAEAEGISYSTLKSRVQKSRGELKALFEDCCHFSLDKNGSVVDYERKDDGKCRQC